MYRYSVNLSIAHYSRRNSIADAYMKPVFVITCERIDLFPDETYFTLFICVTVSLFLSSFIFFALRRRINCFICVSIFFIIHEPLLTYFASFSHHPYLLQIYSYHSHVAFVQKSIASSLWHTFVADRTLSERNINEMCYLKICNNSCSLLFLLDRYYDREWDKERKNLVL